ncbi:hypothetical protein H2248_012028 [Termitomyces sp. 'cryptogamus']|nr:hypothetical protein H2248_012028 [Termitomyces sp. 'cryptogamus']
MFLTSIETPTYRPRPRLPHKSMDIKGPHPHAHRGPPPPLPPRPHHHYSVNKMQSMGLKMDSESSAGRDGHYDGDDCRFQTPKNMERGRSKQSTYTLSHAGYHHRQYGFSMNIIINRAQIYSHARLESITMIIKKPGIIVTIITRVEIYSHPTSLSANITITTSRENYIIRRAETYPTILGVIIIIRGERRIHLRLVNLALPSHPSARFFTLNFSSLSRHFHRLSIQS